MNNLKTEQKQLARFPLNENSFSYYQMQAEKMQRAKRIDESAKKENIKKRMIIKNY